MKSLKSLDFGFADAQNYKRRENKQRFNKVFIKNEYVDNLCDPGISFLIGEKGTGKTAYAVYISNNDYRNNRSEIKYIRETEYRKFITLKDEKHLQLSDYSNIWKVIIYLLFCQRIKENEGGSFNFSNFGKFTALNDAIDEYYYSAFSPEIIQALEFVQNSKLAAELLSKYAKVKGEQSETFTFTESRFQANLFYIQKKFEDAIKQIRLENNYLLFIDGIDIRPSGIPYKEYLECVKGLANAVWEVNNDFFPTIKGGKGRCRVILLIRPDIFESIGLQNQNAKIRDNSVFLDWKTEYIRHRSSKIFEVADHLLTIQQNGCKYEIGKCWDSYFPWDSNNIFDQYDCPTSFINFLRWSYYRPRDIVTLLTLLQQFTEDKEKSEFSLEDFEASNFQRAYSNYLLGEVKDQLSFYYEEGDYEIFLKFFEFLRGKDKFSYEIFSNAYDEMSGYLNSIEKNLPQFMNSKNNFLQFLFDLNLLCYLERTRDGKSHIHWCFRERNYANISPKVKTDLEYQVFYGLSKALNLGKQY
ncbi:P-loop ATPase, Sll1717 family [Desulfocicer niacini]